MGKKKAKFVFHLSSCALKWCCFESCAFPQPDAPRKGDLEASAEFIKKWCAKLYELLDKVALELVCTLYWCSQPGSVALRWREQLVGALVRLRIGLAKDSKAPAEA